MAKQTVQQPEAPVTFHRSERVLTFMAVAVIGVAIASFVAMIVAWLTIGHLPDTYLWSVIESLPVFGFAAGILLIIALTATHAVIKARENRDGAR